MYRIVIDTSILVAALRSRNGASNALLDMVADGRLVPLATPTLFLEYEEVLKRPEQRLAHGLSPDQIDGLLRALASAVEPVDVHFKWRPQLRDPKDEMVLEAAINGRADALITFNNADFADGAKRFAVKVLRPQDVLRRIRS